MLKIGTVPFLVARPLTWGLADRDDVELVEALPADLVRMLRQGEVDVALASSILSLEPENFPFWYDGPVIAADGAVRSVLVLLREGCEASAVQRMALDPASRTGRALAEIVFRDHFGAAPQLVEYAPREAVRLSDCPLDVANDGPTSFDGVQIIGDLALKLADRNPEKKIVDLGETWKQLTRLPFVYAGWIGRQGFDPAEAAHILHGAAVEGMAQRQSLAEEGARQLGLSPTFIRRYLCQDLSYTLPSELVRSSLAEFQARLGLPVS